MGTRLLLLLFLILALGTVGCDHATKRLAHVALAGVDTISLVGTWYAPNSQRTRAPS